MGVPEKNELLFQKGINDNKLPGWQKRGIGITWDNVRKEGWNPQKQEKTFTVRREPAVNEDLPLGEDYRQFIFRLPADAAEN